MDFLVLSWLSVTFSDLEMPRKEPSYARGFTLVELVVVLVLLSILGAVVMSRLQSASAFDALATRDALISLARQAQQYSLGRSEVSLDIAPSGGDWLVSVKADGGAEELASVTVRGRALELETGSPAAATGSCADAFDDSVAADFSLVFDSRANAASVTNNGITENVTKGLRLCINDQDSMSLCVSPGGFAHIGACDD